MVSSVVDRMLPPTSSPTLFATNNTTPSRNIIKCYRRKSDLSQISNQPSSSSDENSSLSSFKRLSMINRNWSEKISFEHRQEQKQQQCRQSHNDKQIQNIITRSHSHVTARPIEKFAKKSNNRTRFVYIKNYF